jgi:uncharacterized protein (UPF0548 family)
MLSFRKPDREFIDRWLEEQKRRNLNYQEVCGTRDQLPAKGYNIDSYSIHLGNGKAVYDRAVDAIRGLHMWDFGWVQLCWQTTPIEIGSVLATLTRQFGVWYLNACRIVYRIEEERPIPRFGFAYGTVEGHIERGEERFAVEWRADDSVWYEILAFSRPAHWLMKLGYPYMRRVQRRFGADSLQAIVRAVARAAVTDPGEAPGAPRLAVFRAGLLGPNAASSCGSA